MLKKGAYAAVMEDEEDSHFCEEDIDQILERRSTTITFDSQDKGPTFSKASFVASKSRSNVEIDDPDFWRKWADRANVDLETVTKKTSLVIDTPRLRNLKRYIGQVNSSASEKDDPLYDGEAALLARQQKQHKRRRKGPKDSSLSQKPIGSDGPLEPLVCSKIEKALLNFGWGCWKEIMKPVRRLMAAEEDVAEVCRSMVVVSLRNYEGDGGFKDFLWQLINPSRKSPLHREGPDLMAGELEEPYDEKWLERYAPERLLVQSFILHLRLCPRKLLVRLLVHYVLKYIFIGDQAQRVMEGVNAQELQFPMPKVDRTGLPAWWDDEADHSLLIGAYKHGFGHHSRIRADPCLCFLKKIGSPGPTVKKKTKKKQASIKNNIVTEGNGPDQEINWPQWQSIKQRLQKLLGALRQSGV